ncbi:MAG TPA: hypothetical protein VK989_12815, partial [Polyangia bacterium]|nr:hypothetical protein [Polyangia bacterium]
FDRTIAARALGISLGCAACATPGVNDRHAPHEATRGEAFPRGYDARSYDLLLTLDPVTEDFKAEVTIELAVTRAHLGDVDLDAVGLGAFETAAKRRLPIFERAVYSTGTP